MSTSVVRESPQYVVRSSASTSAGVRRRRSVVSKQEPRRASIGDSCMVWRRAVGSGHPPGLSPHEVHQDELPQRHRVRKVGLAATDRRHPLHELDQAPVSRQHERVDEDARAPAQRDLAVGGLEDLGVEPHGIDVDLAVGESERRGLAVGDHDDLPHVLALGHEHAARQLEPFRGVGVYGPTCARASCASGISSAVSWNSTTRKVSPGNCVRIRCVSASATFLAGVKRSSPYRIIECEQSSISTVADDDRYSAWCTIRSSYSRLMGTPRPSRCSALVSVALTSRLSVSPYSYCLLTASASIPVARCSVS